MENETQDNLIWIRTFNGSIEANLAKGNLANNGIDCFLEEENVVGLNPLGGTELKVFKKDAEKAKMILGDN